MWEYCFSVKSNLQRPISRIIFVLLQVSVNREYQLIRARDRLWTWSWQELKQAWPQPAKPTLCRVIFYSLIYKKTTNWSCTRRAQLQQISNQSTDVCVRCVLSSAGLVSRRMQAMSNWLRFSYLWTLLTSSSPDEWGTFTFLLLQNFYGKKKRHLFP